MSIIRWIYGKVSGATSRVSGLQNPASAKYATTAAKNVTEENALTLSAFFACVRLISETVASMPLEFFLLDKQGNRTKDVKSDLAKLFTGRVNRYQNRFEFFETMTANLAMHGNAYALKQMDSRKRIIGLLPLPSSQMEVSLGDNGDVEYRFDTGKGTKKYDQDEIWHIKLFGNTIIGLSPISYARISLGIGLAAESTTNKIFQNDGKPAATLTFPEGVHLKADQREQFREDFSKIASGDSGDNLFVLEHGLQYQQVSLSPMDIELLKSRNFQVKDICRFMGVPSVLVNDTVDSAVWGNGIAEIVQGFYKFGMKPYLERYEAAIVNSLLPRDQRNSLVAEFDFKSLLRGDMVTRFKMYKEAVTGGVLTPNEARFEEGYEPKEGGDDLFMQQQMRPINQLQNGEGVTE